jgi:hypothetical protein
MKMKKVLFVMAVVALTYGAAQAVLVSDLTNRYSFLNTGGTEVIDEIRGENGVLDGTAIIADGKLVMDGSGSAHLPGDVLDIGLTSVTIEAWFQDDRTGSNWSRLFDFGGTSGNDGGNALFCVPRQYGQTRFTVATNGYPGWMTGEETVSGPHHQGEPTYVATVWDGDTDTISIYINGVLAQSATTTMDLAAVARQNAFIGDSSYPGDDYFIGSVDEFRIWSVALPEDHIARNYELGPDTVCMTIPEPATIALLSLGGLALIRRRKS